MTDSSVDWTAESILVTGGTGSFGHAFIQHALEHLHPRQLTVFSRDELKQFQMRQEWPLDTYPNLRFFIGDVRDRDRLARVLDGVSTVVHAAALKQVPTAEQNPLEAIKTNVFGAANVIDAAIDRGVRRVLALSTDRAASPINLYGATKLCSDKLFVAANAHVQRLPTRFSVVRYGNVLGSRGSVIPYFLAQRSTGRLTLTDPRMTRFLITLGHAVTFVIESLERMTGGEIFVPKIPSVRITDLARVIGPECDQKVIGIRPGEKLHEVLITEDDARMALDFGDHYVIQPGHTSWLPDAFRESPEGRSCPDGFRYSSDTNARWLTDEEIEQMVYLVQSSPSREVVPRPDEPTFVLGT